MIAIDTLLWLLCVAFTVIIWRDNMRAKEIAVATCKKACESYNVQLLDDTVSLIRILPALGQGARPCLRRTYGFELSATGADRRLGTVTLLGTVVEAIYIPDGDANLIA